MTAIAEQLHQRLAALGAETNVVHQPWCGAHPSMDDGPCDCLSGRLAAVIRAIVDVHQPRESCSINTLSCDEHNVTKPGRIATLSTDDCESCPDCVVTPIVVCSGWGCESYPCETTRAIATALGLAD